MLEKIWLYGWLKRQIGNITTAKIIKSVDYYSCYFKLLFNINLITFINLNLTLLSTYLQTQ